MKNLSKNRKFIFSFIIAYFLSLVLQYLFPLYWEQFPQEQQLENVNLVSLLIDKNLYPKISNYISWYAVDYIQKQNPNTKVIVQPLDIQNIKSWDIVKYLENLYFEWEKDKTSTLKWVILVWDIPLPVVNDNWYIFPTIFPYTDFEDQKYIFDYNSKYFVPNWNENSLPEIWSSMIKFDNLSGYISFFDKLKIYNNNRSNFVAKKVWYDDFILLKQTFSKQLFDSYLNQILFSEDLNYHRFTNTFLSFLQWEYEKNINNMISNYIDSQKNNIKDNTNSAWSNDYYDYSSVAYDPWPFIKFLQKILWEREKANQEAQQIISQVNWTSSSSSDNSTFSAPTLLVWKAILELMKSYDEVVWLSYLNKIKTNINLTDRWKQVDNHVDKMIQQDSLFVWSKFQKATPLFVQYNKILEDIVNDKIEKEKYYMTIPIPVSYHKIKYEIWKQKILWVNKKRCRKSADDYYENYYFWKKASNINSAQDLSIYRWTFLNLTDMNDVLNFNSVDYYKNFSKSNFIDVSKSSVWKSNYVFNTQIEANRWYDSMLWKQDVDLYQENKQPITTRISCSKYFKILWVKIFCLEKEWKLEFAKKEDETEFESPEDFAQRLWWWASSINLWENGRFKSFNYKYAQSPLYDIAWSKALLDPELEANSYLWLTKYASLIQITDVYWPKFYNKKLHYEKIKWIVWKEKEHTVEFDSIEKNILSSGQLNFVDFFFIFQKYFINKPQEVTSVFKINNKTFVKKGEEVWGKCDNWELKDKEIFVYRTIDSRVRNTNPTSSQINWKPNDLYSKTWEFYKIYSDIKNILNEVLSYLKSPNDSFELVNSVIFKSYENISNSLILSKDTLVWISKNIKNNVLSLFNEFRKFVKFASNVESWVEDLENTYNSFYYWSDWWADWGLLTLINDKLNFVDDDVDVILEWLDKSLSISKQIKWDYDNDWITWVVNDEQIVSNITSWYLKDYSNKFTQIQTNLSYLQNYFYEIQNIDKKISDLAKNFNSVPNIQNSISWIVSDWLKLKDATSTIWYYLDYINKNSNNVVSWFVDVYSYYVNNFSLTPLVSYINKIQENSEYKYTWLSMLNSWKNDLVNNLESIKTEIDFIKLKLHKDESYYSQFGSLFKQLELSLWKSLLNIQSAITLVKGLRFTVTSSQYSLLWTKLPNVALQVQDLLLTTKKDLLPTLQNFKNKITFLNTKLNNISDYISQLSDYYLIVKNISSELLDSEYCNPLVKTDLCEKMPDLAISLWNNLPENQKYFDYTKNKFDNLNFDNVLNNATDIYYNIKKISSVTDIFDWNYSYLKNLIDELNNTLKEDRKNIWDDTILLQQAKNNIKEWQYEHTIDDVSGTLIAWNDNIFDLLQSNLGDESQLIDDYSYSLNFITWIQSIPDNQATKTKDWMNITTSDRPIDSIRNVTFQWIWWDLVKLDFPNLYEVEVFKKKDNELYLLSEDQILSNVKTYLINKVKEYNLKLKEQQEKYNQRYQKYKLQFKFLWKSDSLANPYNHHNYNLLPEDYLIKKLEEKDPNALKTIAHILYVQNSLWKERLSSNKLEDNIKFLKQSADINNKISFIMNDYLVQNNTNPKLSLPSYNVSGYELLYLNADDKSFIDSVSSPSFIQKIKSSISKFSSVSENYLQNNEETIWQDLCWSYSPDGGYYLFILWKKKEWQLNWFQAVGCWLNELTWKILWVKLSYEDALWPVVPIFNWSWAISLSWIWDEATRQMIYSPLNEYTWNIKKYKKEWLIQLYKLQLNWYNSKLDLLKNYSWDYQDKINDLLTKINYVEQKIKDLLWTIATWSFTTNEILENNNYSTTWLVDKIVIKLPINYVLSSGQIPLYIEAYDKFNNEIWQTLNEYYLTVDSWTIYWYTWIDFSRFPWSFAYIAPNISKDELKVNVSVYDKFNKKLLAKKTITVYKPYINVYSNTWWNVSNIFYTLKDSPSKYFYEDKNGITQIIPSSFPNINISVKNYKWEQIITPVKVYSEKWLIYPVIVNKKIIKTWVVKTSWKKVNMFVLDKNVNKIYFKSNFKAWTDVIHIDLPWNISYKIPITFASATAKVFEISWASNAELNSSVDCKLKIKDIRWNLINWKNVALKLWIIGDWNFNSWKKYLTVNTNSWLNYINFHIWNNWWKIYLFAYNQNLPIDSQSPWLITLNVYQNIIPQTWLNVMYANILWTDWWNLWWYFSKNVWKAQQWISTSNKMLALTTELIDPKKIKKTDILLSQTWIIKQNVSLVGDLSFIENNLWFYVWKEHTIPVLLGNLTDFKYLNKKTLISLPNDKNNYLFYVPNLEDSFVKQNVLKDKKIYFNWKVLVDFEIWKLNRHTRINLTKSKKLWLNVWSVKYDWKQIWLILLKISNNIIDKNIQKNAGSDIFSVTFWEWTTNWTKNLAISFSSNSTYNKKWFDSVEFTVDPDKNIAFANHAQRITSFAWWETVWEATKKSFNEFAINFWDPYLRRLNKNNLTDLTNYDKNPWKVVFEDRQNSILKTLYGDINNDWLKDLLVVYKNWKVKWLKDYSWKEPFKNLWDLMFISDKIKNVYLWDVDWNWYDDLIVWLQSDKLKVYLNNKWIFGVDGYPICLNLPRLEWKDPDWVWLVKQLFVRDMDNDWKIDIITNDQDWNIKIHYWWSSTWTNAIVGSNYVSLNLTGCDSDWQSRQKNEVKLVKSYLVYVDPTQKVVDDSLIRWKWVDRFMEEKEYDNYSWLDFSNSFQDTNYNSLDILDIVNQASNKDKNKVYSQFTINDLKNFDIQNINKLPKSLRKKVSDKVDAKDYFPTLQNFPVDSIVNRWKSLSSRWQRDPNTNILPLYEDISLDDVRYFKIKALSPQKDVFKVYKTYKDLNGWKLRRGDKVKVTITIQWQTNIPLTYIDKITWPWNPNIIDFDTNKPYGFWIKNINSWWQYHLLKDNDEYSYMIDNIILTTWKVQFGYVLEYQWWSNVNIKLEDTNNDKFTDIKVFPLDWCAWIYYKFVNTRTRNNRNYAYTMVDTNKVLNNVTSELENNYKNFLNNVASGFDSYVDNKDTSSLPGLSSLIENFDFSTFWDYATDWWVSQTITTDWILNNILSKFNLNSDQVDQAIDKMTKWLCKWFILWNKNACQWPPIPFNMAFLSPWNYQIFGCKVPTIIPWVIWNDNWFPIFAFPAWMPTWVPPYIPMPFPRGWITKLGWVDTYWYFWFPSPVWPFPSMVRIYLSPTLTLWLWVAFCFGPQKPMSMIPSPLRDIVWNCVVVALPYQSPSCEEQLSWTNNQELNETLFDRSNLTCNNPPILPWNNNWTYEDVSTSAFFLQASDWWNLPWPPINPWTYWPWWIWFINFNYEPLPPDRFNTNNNSDKNEWVDLIWAEQLKNKIRWWMLQAKGLIKCIINDWVDRQVKYIINNLTNMTIGVYVPNIFDLAQWFDSLNYNNLKQLLTQQNSVDEIKFNNITWNVTTWDNTNKIWMFLKDHWINKVKVQNFSNKIFTNPFDAMSTLFNDIPLINISTQKINIQVPFIYSEDVTKYKYYLKNWLDVNTRILNNWIDSLGWVLGVCNVSFGANKRLSEDEIQKRLDLLEQQNLSDKEQSKLDKLKKNFYKMQDNTKKYVIVKKNVMVARMILTWKNKNSIYYQIKNNLPDNVNFDELYKWLDEYKNIIKFLDGIIQDNVVLENDFSWDINKLYKLQKSLVFKLNTYGRLEWINDNKKIKNVRSDIFSSINDNLLILDKIYNQATVDPDCVDLIVGWWFAQAWDDFLWKSFAAWMTRWLLSGIDTESLIPSMWEMIQNFIKLFENFGLTVKAVKNNISVLDEYKLFPFQLYDWIHISDRYLTELLSMIESFTNTLTSWLSKNWRIFEQYVDAIITLVWVIKTWQAIIDLSVNWSKKCSTCTNDNYQFYWCGFWFICKFINLPILPIPPFKIPSIYLDFSHIDASIDIKIPEFKFVPVSIQLPQIPNLPQIPPVLQTVKWDFGWYLEDQQARHNALKQFTKYLWYKAWTKLLEMIINSMSWDLSNSWNLNISGLQQNNLSWNEFKQKLQNLKITIQTTSSFLKNLDSFQIPTLPSPPKLPPLPSFIPTVKLDLPDLPPAPKIPKLIPQVEVILDVADLIWKIYCIVKWKIWLVSEKWVKSKIEQLTQRTWNVPWFDNIDLTLSSYFPKDKLQWFDWKIDTYITFKYNFSYLYDIIVAVGEYVSDKVNSISNLQWFNINEKINDFLLNKNKTWTNSTGFKDKVKNFFEGSIQKATDVIDDIQWTNIDLDSYLPSTWKYWLNKSLIENLNYIRFGQKNPYWKLVDYKQEKQRLKKYLNLIETRAKSQKEYEIAKKISDLVFFDKKVQANTWDVIDALNFTKALISNKIKNNKKLSDLIYNNYDKFLLSISKSNIKSVWKSEKLDLKISVPLFKADSKTINILKNQESPLKSYLDLQNKLLNWFENKLKQSQPGELWMTNNTYLKIWKEISYLKSFIRKYESLQKDFDSKSSGNLVEIKLSKLDSKLWKDLKSLSEFVKNYNNYNWNILSNKKISYISNHYVWKNDLCKYENQSKTWIQLQQKNNLINDFISWVDKKSYWLLPYKKLYAWNVKNTTSSSWLKDFDISQYIKWIFVKSNKWDNYVKISNSKFHESKIWNNYYLISWLNDNLDDILLRDNRKIYIKYANQNSFVPSKKIKIYKKLYLNSYWNRPEQYIKETLNNDWYKKIWDSLFKIASVHYEVKNFKVNWQSYDSISISWTNSNKIQNMVSWYIVRFTQRADLFDTKFKIYNNKFFDKSESPVQYILVLPDWMWTGYKIYVPWELNDYIWNLMTWIIVKTESYIPDLKNINISLTDLPRKRYYLQVASLSLENWILKKKSMWSNQIVWWQQIISDDIPPIPSVELFRIKKNKVIDEWLNLEGYINTHYDFKIKREDNLWVKSNWYIISWIKYTFTWNTSVLKDRFFPRKSKFSFEIWAEDYEWNISTNTVNFVANVPSIEIIKTEKVDDKRWNIIAKISHDLDEWSVQFQKKRSFGWEAMQWDWGGSLIKQFQVRTDDIVVTWWLFTMDKTIALHMPNWDIFAKFNPLNWELNIYKQYSWSVKVYLDFKSNIPILHIVDLSTKKELFKIYIPSKKLLKVDLKNWLVSKTKINNKQLWLFNWWSCLNINNEKCVLFVSKNWMIYVPSPYNMEFNGKYVYDSWFINYKIYDWAWNNIFDIQFEPKSMLK